MVAPSPSDPSYRTTREKSPDGDSRRVPKYNHLSSDDVEAWSMFVESKLDDMDLCDALGTTTSRTTTAGRLV